jgi:hypothetical protein
MTDERHHLSIVWQHAVADLWSIGLLERELWTTYDALGRGEAAPGPEDPLSFGDVVRAAEASPSAAEQRAFWAEELAGVPDAAFSGILQGPGGFRLPSAERRVATRPLDPARLEALAAWCRTRAVTMSTLFHGLWALVLARYLGLDDVVLGSVVSGRWSSVARVEDVVGPTMGVVLLRARIASSAPFVPWLLELQARLAAVQRFIYTPWDRIAAAIDRRAVPVGSTLAVENLPDALWQRPCPGLDVHDLEHRTHMPQPLMISVFPVPKPHLKATFDPSFVSDVEVAGCLDGLLGGLARLAGEDGDIARVEAGLEAVPRRAAPR